MELLKLWVLVAYTAIICLVAYLSSRKESLEGYLIADRKLNAISSAFSIVASKMGAGMLLAFVAYIYVFGVSAIFYIVGAAVGYACFILFARMLKTASHHKKYYTLIDYVKDKVGSTHAIWIAIMLFAANILTLVVQLIGGGKIIASMFSIPFIISVVITLGIILLYLYVGGFRAVVYTDVLQAIGFIVLFVAITVMFQQATVTPATFESMPISLVVAFFLIGFIYPFGSHELYQRVYATKHQDVRRSLIIASVVYVTFGSLIVWLGLAIKSLFPNVDPDTSIITAFTTFLSPEWTIVAALAFFLVVMSSADTMLFNCVSIYLNDIRNNKTKSHYKLAFVLFTIGSGILAILFKNIINVVLIYAGIVGYIGTIVVFSWLFKINKQFIPNMYRISTVLLLLIFAVSGMNPSYIASSFILVPLSYWISKAANLIVHRKKNVK